MTKTLRQKLMDRKGFTLIELIVVIAIIAILAAVLIPRFAGFTKTAHRNAVTSDARNILLSIEAMNSEGQPYIGTNAITAANVDSYTGKKYFTAATPTCAGLAFIDDEDGTVTTVNADVIGFKFTDTQGSDTFTAIVIFATDTITVTP